jgi:protein-S-isoprenylcysteine O-methyltransferase Ste14
VVCLLALLCGDPVRNADAPAVDAARTAAGWVLALAGQALRIVTIGYQYIIRGGKSRRVYAEGLVQGGVFAACRNPLYVGNLLIALGLALVVNSPAFYLVFIPFMVAAYASIVAAEEHFLGNKFGMQYAAYCQRVPRWRLCWSALAAELGRQRFDWRRVVVKEYNTAFTLLLGLVGLGLWGDYMAFGRAALPAAASWWPAIFLWLILYAGVRMAKKRGYLSA